MFKFCIRSYNIILKIFIIKSNLLNRGLYVNFILLFILKEKRDLYKNYFGNFIIEKNILVVLYFRNIIFVKNIY